MYIYVVHTDRVLSWKKHKSSWAPQLESCKANKRRMMFVVITNLQNKGWISVDRGTKATLTRTIPRSLFKSYTKDLSFQIFELVFQHRLADMLLPTAVPLQCYDLEHTREYAYCYSWEHHGKQTYRRFSSMDSGLEAFSRNPTHGSFPPLAFPLSGLPIMWTNGSSRTKLDYCRGDRTSSVG